MAIDVVIVGGGISGLAFAYYFLRDQPNARIKVIEASARWGGTIRTDFVDDLPIDVGPDAWVGSAGAASDLASELGLACVQPAVDRVLFFAKKRLVAVPEGVVQGVPTRARSVLQSPILSVAGKARTLLRFVRPVRSVVNEQTSVSELLRAHFGKEWAERIAKPLLSGVFSTPIEHLAAQSAWPKLAEWAAAGASPRAMRDARPRLEAPSRGMQSLVDALAETLKKKECQLQLDNEVVKIESGADDFFLHTRHGIERSKQVVLAAPLGVSLKLLLTKNSTHADGMVPPMWAPMSMVIVATKSAPKPLAATGWLVTEPNDFGLTAVTLLHEKWRRNHAQNGVFRLFFRSSHRTDRELESLAIAHIESVLQRPLDVARTWVRRFDPGSFLRTPEHLKFVNDTIAAHPSVNVLGVRSTGISSAIAEAKARALGVAANFKSC
jgi:oxygen-dependent protoporphyrinogen oxidase